MTEIICFWEAPRSRGTSISFALSHGIKAGGFDCIFRDEPLHRRKLKLLADEEGVPARDKYVQDIKIPVGYAADFIIQKEQAKWLFDERTRDCIGPDLDWIRGYKNILLLRDAYEMVTSHQRKLALEGQTLDMEAVGIKQLLDVFQFLKEQGEPFTVVDTNELLVDPEKGMQKLCERLEIPFSEAMIKWEKPDIQPPLWGPHWYEDIMSSDGLHPYRPLTNRSSLPASLDVLVLQTDKIIAEMRPQRLRFDSLEAT